MQIPGFCSLVVICVVLQLDSIFKSFLGFSSLDCASCLKFPSQSSEFGCGFLVFGCFSQAVCFLGLFLMFGAGMMVLGVCRHGKGLLHLLYELRSKSTSLKSSVAEVCDSTTKCYDCDSVSFLGNPESLNEDDYPVGKEVANPDSDAKLKEIWEENSDENECYDEDEEFDVTALRKLVKIERQRANAAYVELEKERMAAASAAQEAMAMILRLQSEKSSSAMQAIQYRRLAEQKQQYDQEVIRTLQWIVMKHESYRSLLEDQLKLYRQKLKLFVKGDEVDGREGVGSSMSFLNSSLEDGLDDALISSLDMDSLMF